ncbi:hypothetical protein BDR04DRAFT_1007018 [Suillus decipiens]|nr:hypothetical protein BDR04DRAFT_1007018 [Suillus decipiens]
MSNVSSKSNTCHFHSCYTFLCQAIDFFLSTPNQQDISGHKMTDSEWQVLKDLEKILDVPHRVQQQISSESMPRLGSAVPCFELFMTAWESLTTKFPQLHPSIDVGLEWAKSYYIHMDLTDTYVIVMCKSTILGDK